MLGKLRNYMIDTPWSYFTFELQIAADFYVFYVFMLVLQLQREEYTLDAGSVLRSGLLWTVRSVF